MEKTADNSIELEDNFKKKFKYYKANKAKPSLRDVISVDFIKDDKVSVAIFQAFFSFSVYTL